MNFIESPDCAQSPPPFEFPGVELNIFKLKADRDALQSWCDDFLNVSSDYNFQALAPFVLLCVNYYPKMILENFKDLGYSTQNEYFFMFPVLRWDNLNGFQLPADLTWAVPFIGVDNSTSALAGQMVLGFPKLVGELALETATDGSFSAAIAMPGMPQFTRNTAQQLLPIIDVTTGVPVAVGANGLSFPWSLVVGVSGNAAIDDAVLALLELVDPSLFSATNLKQFRNGADPAQAAYQGLVRAEWQQANTSPPVFYGSATVTVTDNATIRIAARMGLADPVPSGTGQAFAADLALSITTDLWFGNVMNLTQSP